MRLRFGRKALVGGLVGFLASGIGASARAACADDLLYEPPPTLPRVLVIGDSMSQGLTMGLANVVNMRATTIDAKGMVATGIFGGRDLPGGWLAWSARYARGAERHAAAVVLVGINETVGLSGDPRNPATRDYLERAAAAVSQIALNLRQRAGAVFWIGLPRMGRGDAATILLDETIKTAAPAAGAHYVETRSMTEWQGQYHANAWGGRLLPSAVRHEDGVHFSGRSNDLLAAHVVAAMERTLGFSLRRTRLGNECESSPPSPRPRR